MSASKLVRTRTPGWCSADFAHPSRIEVGDLVKVTVYFASDEQCTTFGVKPLSRYRRCSWCVEEERRLKKWQDDRA